MSYESETPTAVGSLGRAVKIPLSSYQTQIVNLGCGSSSVPGYLNIDGSPTVLLAHLPLPADVFGGRREFVQSIRAHKTRYGKAQKLRFPRGTLDGFYTSHVLEHLAVKECEQILRRCRVWLKPTGVLRVVLPDLRRIAAAYMLGEIDADTFTGRTHLSVGSSKLTGLLFGHSFHRWMYDAESFKRLLQGVGFREVAERSYRDSQMLELAELDVAARKDESFYIEALP